MSAKVGPPSVGARRRAPKGCGLYKQLRGFCFTMRAGTLTAAAKALHTSQPSLSIQIRMLERALGARLFIRRAQSLVPTDAARRLYTALLPLVEEIDRLPERFEERFRATPGTLRIAASETASSYLLGTALRRLRDAHPEISADVHVGSGAQCVRWLRQFDVDVALCAMDSYSQRDDIAFAPLVTSHFVLITPPDHPLAEHPQVCPPQLSHHPQVAHPPGRYIRDFGEMYLRTRGLDAKVVCEIDGWEAIKECVESGIGIAIVPDLCLRPHDRVARVRFEAGLRPRTYGYLLRRAASGPLAVTRFVDTVSRNPP